MRIRRRPARRARRRRPPGSRRPRRSTPTARRLAPASTTALRAPASTWIRPATRLPCRSQSLNADAGSAAAKRVPRARPASASARIPVAAPSAITVGMPAPAASSAAAILLSIPPRPTARSRAEVDAARGRAVLDEHALAQHAGHRGEQHEQPRVHEHGDLRGERVVVAEADLVGRRRVVLVHDRHAAEREERGERVAHVHVRAALGDLGARQQDLRGVEPVRAECVLPRALQRRLPERRRSLEARQARRPPREARAVAGRARSRRTRRRRPACRLRRSPRSRPRGRAAACAADVRARRRRGSSRA